ncbi:hypothetical protein LMH87_002029 [Akanthomyces muscarius]|uniref:Uncharacterized protein n=1 Tax=Akanthomyces muscarius TaxID=2231603 RepID=A0A9W8UIU6_AKAMU|nr:hypothetical protein LMH87_002029 [Akanthomyces muscarius]KAJ4147517.1 hypothetical protein LMH87_002029 [Akanthomyces muscarius]
MIGKTYRLHFSGRKSSHHGNRFADHKCKVLQSRPHQEYHVNECIDLQNVGSLNMNFPGSCRLYDVMAKLRPTSKPTTAMESRGRWAKVKSFDCTWKD